MSQFNKYNGSFLASENLTYYVCENQHTFKVKLYIPDVYDFLVDVLKHSSTTESNILTIPAVRGYVFEKKFLSSMKLRETSLTVLAVNCQTSGSGRGPLEFDFPALTPCDNQLIGPLKTKLEDCQVYHLRQRHPAIDAVVFIDGANCSVSIDSVSVREKCLLLLQVSISCYQDHESKGNDIRKTIPAMEGGEGSIAEYYQTLCGVAIDKVIYVYVSPKETSPPSSTIFNHELNIPNTRSGDGRQSKFFYGFLKSESRGATLVQEIVNSI
jgi:hypothetical protein